MPLKDKFTSLAVPPASAAALLALAILCWPAQTSAQTVRAPQISVDSAFSVAPIGAGGAAQQGTFLALTDWATRAMNKLTQLSDRGRLEPVTAEERRQLGNLGVSSEAQRFRIGMFVEYVTKNMLALYQASRTLGTCAPQVQQLAQVVKSELEQLENFKGGRVNGAVFGRNVVTAKVGCP